MAEISTAALELLHAAGMTVLKAGLRTGQQGAETYALQAALLEAKQAIEKVKATDGN